MTTENVIRVRDMLRNTPNKTGIVGQSPVFIIVDNLRIIDERFHCVKWDDENELVYAFMSPEAWGANQGIGTKAPMQLIVTQYEHIQYIGQQFNYESLKNYIGPQLELTDQQIENIRKFTDPSGDERLKSIRTKPQMDVLTKEDEYRKSQMDYDHLRPRDI